MRREDEYDPAGGGNTFSVREDGEYLLFQDRIENGLMSGAVMDKEHLRMLISKARTELCGWPMC